MSRRWLPLALAGRLATWRQVLGVVVVLILACGPGPTDGDRIAQQKVDEQFNREFRVRLSAGTYVEARYLIAGCPPRDRAESLFRALWFDTENRRRTDTNFTYLNCRDSEGQFCFQLSYDPATGRIEKSEQAYY